MTRRERLMATLRGEPVDRPAVCFYEIGGFRVNPADPDPFNVYNAPAWQPLLRLAEERTDLIRMMSPVRAQSHAAWDAASSARAAFFRTDTHLEGGCRMTRTTVRAGGRTLTSLTKREPDIDTVWTVEHLLKDADDLDAYLQIPDEAFAETIDLGPLAAEEAALGDRGIVMVDTEDPICAAATLFSMEDFTIVALTEPERFHRLLEQCARPIHARTAQVAEAFPGRLWRIYGPEFATEPYLPPRLFDEYVVRYTGPMVKMIQAHGGFARLHVHGRLRGVLDLIAGMGVDALDPLEPPPHGDVPLAELRARVGGAMALFGNIEIADIENRSPDGFERMAAQALADGTAGTGRGFVLMPTASPYGRTISPATLANYTTLVRLAEGAAG